MAWGIPSFLTTKNTGETVAAADVNKNATSSEQNWDNTKALVGNGTSAPTNDMETMNTTIAGILLASTGRSVISSNAVDADHDIDVSAGYTVDSTGSYVMAGSAVTKLMDTAWAAGDGAGGLFNGALAASTAYNFYKIRKDADGSIDYGGDTYAAAVTNLPAGYSVYGRIAHFMTDSASNILPLYQVGNEFFLKTLVQDIAANNPGASAVSATTSAPPLVLGRFSCGVSSGNAVTRTYAAFTSLSGADIAPSSALFNVSVSEEYAVGNQLDLNTPELVIYTNASSQIRYRLSQSAATETVYISTIGWKDTGV